MVSSSYIHIPFCSSKCRYCAFVSFLCLNYIEEYIKVLEFEIKEKYKKEKQKTLYFGGGTPSILSYGQIEKILNLFNFEKEAEITVEINPETVDFNYLKALFKMGVNRLSVGIQTFDDEILKVIGRCHNSARAIQTVKEARRAGFQNISVDLIYGLPNQNIKKWKKDLKIVKNLEIEHISTYGLKIEDKTYFKKFPPDNLPDDDIQADMYEVLVNELKDFCHYEISNFAKSKKYFSNHNLNYWNCGEYYGFGAGASGFIQNVRYKNNENLKNYLKNPLEPLEKTLETKENLLEETIFLGLRKSSGVNIFEINKKFDIDFLKKYEGVIKKYEEYFKITKEGNLRLNNKGFLISNYILCDFLN